MGLSHSRSILSASPVMKEQQQRPKEIRKRVRSLEGQQLLCKQPLGAELHLEEEAGRAMAPGCILQRLTLRALV